MPGVFYRLFRPLFEWLLVIYLSTGITGVWVVNMAWVYRALDGR